MSWISGLADKAENILNTIDQNAANALQIPMTDTSGIPTTLDTLRKGISSGTESLKLSLSTSKRDLLLRSDGSLKNNANNVDTIGTDQRNFNSELIPDTGIPVSQQEDAISIDMTEHSLSSTVNTELAPFKIAVNDITSERDELQRLRNINKDMENVNLKQRVHDLEMLTQRLTEERDRIQTDLCENQKLSKVYIHSISELESNLAKLQQQYLAATQKLHMQAKAAEQQQQEMEEYRTKAQRALAMKDNVIAELKSKTKATDKPFFTSDDSKSQILLMELNELKLEHQHLIEENRNMQNQLEETRRDWNAISKSYEEKFMNSCLSEDCLRKELRSERERSLLLESENRVFAQELSSLRQQLSNQMAIATARLQEQEQQLTAVNVSKSGTTTKADCDLGYYNERIKALTQSLVDKQNVVEQITSERNALRIQLEKMQIQLQQSIYSNNNVSNMPRNALLSNSTDDAKAQYPLLMKETPFDNHVARRVKRAYSSLDSAGIRLGTFLRRYPLMRVLVLMYVGLLHLWVMFVLLSSTPN